VDGRPIPLDAAFPFVLARLCDAQLDVSLGDLIDATLARQAFAASQVVVDPSVADFMVEQRRATGMGIIPWEAIIDEKGRMNPLRTESIAWIRHKFDVWVGIEEILGPLDEVEVLQYFTDQQVMIGRAAVKLVTLKTLTEEVSTCRRKNPEGRAIARRKIDKALEELRAGEDFSKVVMHYSEEPGTRRYVTTTVAGNEIKVAGAPVATNIRDSRVPDEVAAAAFFAPYGEWIGPNRTLDGFVILEVVGGKPPTPFPYDSEPYQDLNENGRWDEGEPHDDTLLPNDTWDAGRRSFAYNELLTDRAARWIASLREKADIENYRISR
jgi:hypothetical protein